MADIWLYKLKTKGPFHFGERGVGIEAAEEVFHSDSLFSALAFGVRMWERQQRLKDVLAAFLKPEQSPPFRITSLFPYAGDVLFFPRPMLPITASQDKGKDIRGIRFVSHGIFQSILRNESPDAHLEPGDLLHNGAVWLTEEERLRLALREGESFWRRSQAPRVTVDRRSAESRVYYAGQLTFTPGCGLWFFLETDDPQAKRLVDGALQYLSEAGLGGERAVGRGQFEVESCSIFTPFWLPQANAFITLSLYHPTLIELGGGILGEPATYELSERRGWVASPERGGQRRKSIVCLAEGSLLRSLGGNRYGDLANVSPELPGDHPVFRYGFAFPVPVRVEEPPNDL